jgi:hypothetical protein
MYFRVRALAVPCAVIVALILATSAFAQEKDKKQPKYSKEQVAEAQALLAVVDAVAAGTQPAPADIQVTFQNHFMRSIEGKTFIPYTLAIDPAALTTPGVLLYVRAVNKNQAAAPVAAPADNKDKDKKKGAHPEYAWEDYYFIDVKPTPGQTEPYRITRSLGLNAGEYEFYAALRLYTPGEKKDKNAPAAKTTVLKQAINAPDYMTAFSTSSILVLSKIEDLTAPLNDQQRKEQPYTFGTMKMTPALVNKFTKKDELSLIFLIYNAPLDPTTKKPNVTIDYTFLKKAKEGDKFEPFNRTAPQTFSAETLPATWDGTVTNQLSAGQSVPLASFAENEYRCEIKITDKLTNKVLTEVVSFTVGQ